jgi:hypothetical protein
LATVHDSQIVDEDDVALQNWQRERVKINPRGDSVQNQKTHLVPFESDACVVERSRCKCHCFSIEVLWRKLNKQRTHGAQFEFHKSN